MNNPIDINVHERLEALVARRKLSKAKRLLSMKNRLRINVNGFLSGFEDIK